MGKDMSEKRAQHRLEVIRYLQELRDFNNIAAKECEKWRPALEKLIATMPPPPTNPQGCVDDI